MKELKFKVGTYLKTMCLKMGTKKKFWIFVWKIAVVVLYFLEIRFLYNSYEHAAKSVDFKSLSNLKEFFIIVSFLAFFIIIGLRIVGKVVKEIMIKFSTQLHVDIFTASFMEEMVCFLFPSIFLVCLIKPFM